VLYLLWRSPIGRGIWLGGTFWRVRGAVGQVCARAAALVQWGRMVASLNRSLGLLVRPHVDRQM
jgi:hypothetical protein